MSRRSPVPRIALAAALLAVPTFASGSTRIARAAGGSSPEVVAGSGGLEVRDGERSTRLTLPPRSRVERIVGLSRGWVLAATAPDGDARELLLLADTGDGPSELPPPAGRRASRAEPVPVAVGGELAGLLWLEGPRETEHAVRWASWNGGGFDAPAEVAAPGPGSQVALRAAALEDGRVLAVWASFDGEDDEIRGSVLGRDGWSAPVRVGADNRVPDILPTLAAESGGGARIAWCRFDGSEYGVATARFDGERFVESAAAGPPGSLYPSFERLGEESALLWFDAHRDRWVVARWDGERLIEEASTPGSSDHRPAVVRAGTEILFRFQPEDRR